MDQQMEGHVSPCVWSHDVLCVLQVGPNSTLTSYPARGGGGGGLYVRGRDHVQYSDTCNGQSATGVRAIRLTNERAVWACPCHCEVRFWSLLNDCSKKTRVGAHRARSAVPGLYLRPCVRAERAPARGHRGCRSLPWKKVHIGPTRRSPRYCNTPSSWRGRGMIYFSLGAEAVPDESGCGAQQWPPVRLQLDRHQTMGVAEPCCCSAKCHYYYYSPLGDNYEKKEEEEEEEKQQQQEEVKKKREREREKRRHTTSTCGPPSPSSGTRSPATADTHGSRAALRWRLGCA
ncbi:hypothetical protein INR49_021633 [Caranx melampygus]|nr:hypothetical protein INR49_021633 [Caranx melampygus]